jgi:hypothetical protein
MGFVINWRWKEGAQAYLPKNSSNRQPYVDSITHPNIKVWKTRKSAEKVISKFVGITDYEIIEIPS